MGFANNRIDFLKTFIFHKPCGAKMFGGEDTSSYLCEKHKKRIEVGYRGVPIIDACFDSDRLDLTRVGIIPDPDKMATKEGAEKARLGLK